MYGNYNGYGRQSWATPSFNGTAQNQFTPVVPMGGYPSQQPMPVAPQQYDATAQRPPLQGVAWVNGLIGAQAYLIPANTSVILMDSDGAYFYIKTSDASGKADVKRFRYTEEPIDGTNPVAAPDSGYVTKEEFERFKASLLEKKTEEEVKL